MKILIVDDQEDNRYLLENILHGLGHESVKAGNGEEALGCLKGGGFGMIISDILMPVMDGFELCRRVKKNPAWKNVLFVFYTATYTDQKDEEFALKLGADAFLRKPLEPQKFIDVIHELIGEKPVRPVGLSDQPGSPEENFLKLHRDRLFRKLEHKLQRLEEEIEVRKKAEARLEALLKEKESLLQEIHHRVKNNLQILTSLLRLQAILTKNEECIRILNENQYRIRSMALVHEQLYSTENFAQIDFAEYLNRLVPHLFSVFYEKSSQIQFNLEIKKTLLDIRKAIPMGLLANELVTNALKHAFPGDIEGLLVVKLETDRENLSVLTVSDNGIGLPEGYSIDEARTLGMQLIKDLSAQIGGEVDLKAKPGATFVIRFTADA